MTRQRLAQLARIAAGTCMYCDNSLHDGSKAMCYFHLVRSRSNQRKRNGWLPHHQTGMGAAPIPRVPRPATNLPDQAA